MKILANSHSAFSRDVSKLSVNGSSHWRDSNPRPEHSGCGKRRPWRPSRPFPNNLIREPTRLQSGPSARSGLLSASRPKAIGLWYQSNLSDCPICTPQYPNLRRAGNRPIPTDLRAVSHGVRVQKQRMSAQQSKFDERADRRSESRSEKGDLLSNIKWLGREGSNLRMAESKSAALPLGYAPTGLFPERRESCCRTPFRHRRSIESGRPFQPAKVRNSGSIGPYFPSLYYMPP